MHISLKIIKTLLYSYSTLHVSGTLAPIIRSLAILHIQPPVTVCRWVGCIFQLWSVTTVAILVFIHCCLYRVFRAVRAAGSISYQHNGNHTEKVKQATRTCGLTLEEVTGICELDVRGSVNHSTIHRAQPDNVHHLHVQQPFTYEKPEAVFAVLGSW
jgi:hypothetical protein